MRIAAVRGWLKSSARSLATCRSKAIFAEPHFGGNRFDCGLKEIGGLAVFVCFENWAKTGLMIAFLKVLVVVPSALSSSRMVAKRIS